MGKCCCSFQFWSIFVVVIAVAITYCLPTLMSSLLRYMFTSPNQQPWPYGSLRLINCSGIPAQALYSTERINELEQIFQHQPDKDVWVVSYVKSGTTWTIGILAALWDDPAASQVGNIQKTTRKFCPQPELPDLGWDDDGFGHSIDELNSWHINEERKRCFKSHWPNQDFHTNSKKNSKHIYVMRNAYDQMISHWNQVWGMGFHYGTQDVDFDEGWDDFVDDWFNGNVEMGKYFDHIAGWYERIQNDPTNGLLIRYEDLKTNTDETIQRIAKFVDTPIDDTLLTKVKDMTSMDRMREADEKDLGLRFMRWLGVLRKHHIRQGKIGGNELKLSSKHKSMLEQEYENKLKPLGIPREWIFLD